MATSLQIDRATRVAVLALSAAVFWRTAYPTITWWDSSSYSLAAATLGINGPPGSLLLTLLGWPVARLPGASPAHTLNLFAGALAALATMLVCVIATGMLRRVEHIEGDNEWAAPIGAALGALTFAFSGTLWEYGVKFTPYILSAVFTTFILWTLVRWWDDADDPNAARWLALLGVLFGLDFSVHRTNALLIPGALVWILVRRPRTLRTPRAVLAGTGGLIAGLSVQMLLIPIAAFTRSALNFNEPSDLSRFWDYVTIKQLGGSFLLGVFPRKSPIWSVQTADLLHVLGDNFLRHSGRMSVFTLLPALFACIGLIVLWRGNRRLAAAFAVLLLTQAVLTVLYFNIPPDYFRTFDRHYLPVCVTTAVLAACGLGAAASRAAALMRARAWVPAVAIAVLVAIVPVAQIATNWSAQDASNRYFARDYAANALLTLPRDAIYFTVGDNDTFPLMYLQSAEGVRPDVTIINLSVANVPEWPDQLRRREPRIPLSLSFDQRRALGRQTWPDTSVTIPVTGTGDHLALPVSATIPASITFPVRPVSGSTMVPSEIVLLDILETNAWSRPLTFAVTGTRSAMEWLAPYGRMDGLYYRVVPVTTHPVDPDLLRSHLFENAQYRGYADPTVRVDDVSRTMGLQSYAVLLELLDAERTLGLSDTCRADRRTMLAKLPPERLGAPREYLDAIESACGSP